MLDHSNQNNYGDDKLIDFGYYFHLVKTRRISIVVFSVLVTAISALVTLSITPTYKATAVLLIESSEKKAISIEEVVGFDTSAKEYYQTQFEILKSNRVSQRVIDKLQLSHIAEFNPSLDSSKESSSIIKSLTDEIRLHPLVASYFANPATENADALEIEATTNRKVLNSFKKKLTIAPIRNTQLVKISFESQNPKLAAKIANEVGLAFIENNLEAKLLATEQATSWINQRLEELKEKLDDSEQNLLRFLEQQKLIDDQGIIALTSSELSNLTGRIAQATDLRIKTQALYNALQGNEHADVSTLASISQISNHPQIRDIRLAESNAEKQVSELSKRYGPKHDKMIQANAQLASIQNRAQSIVKKLINGIEKELSTARKQEALLKRELLEKKDEFQSLSVVKREYDALKREVDTNTKLYDLFLTRQKETSATSDFSSANARISDYALVPEVPDKPNRKLLVVLAMVVSAGAAAAIVIVLDAFNNKIESARDFENKLGLLPTGTVPLLKDKRYKTKSLDSAVFSDSKYRVFQESFDSIRTSLLLGFHSTDRKVLAISSSVPGEGKTTASINLALSFSKLEKVLLIDSDLRKPAISKRFNIAQNHSGLTNVLLMNTSVEESIVSIQESGLDVLTAGMIAPNPQEILSSASYSKLIEQLAERYDRIIIDTPPILPVKDAFITGRITRGVVLVVKANSTSKSVFKHTMNLFAKHDIKLDGVILNQTQTPKKGNHSYSEYANYAHEKGTI